MAVVEITIKGTDGASGVLQSVKVGLEGIEGAAGGAQNAGGGFFSNLASTAGGFLASNVISGITSQFTGLIGSGLSFNNSMEQVTAKLNAFTKDGAKSAEILDMIKDRAAKTPFAFEEMATATAALLPASKASGEGLEKLVSTAEILAASNPAQGLEGAAFALKEAMSGDYGSIIERFDLPRQRLNELKAQGVPALEAIKTAMGEMGLDTSLVANMAETASGRWSTFQDTITGVISTVTQPIFDTLSSSLGGVNKMLEDATPAISSFATGIAGGVSQAISSIAAAVPLAQAAWHEISAVFESDGLTGVFTDIAGAIQDAIPGLTQLTDAGQNVGTVFDMIGGIVGTAISAISQGVAQSGESISTGFSAYTTAADTVIGVFSSLTSTIIGVLSAIQAGIATHGAAMTSSFIGAWSSVQSTIANVLGGIAAVIQPILAQVNTFVQAHGAEIAAAFASAWGQVATIVRTAMALVNATVVPALHAIGGFVTAHGAEIQAAFSAAWNIVSTIVSTVLATIQGVLKAALQAIQGDWSGAWNTIKQTCATIVVGILAVVKETLTGLGAVFTMTLDAALGIVGGFVGRFSSSGADLIAGLASGIRNAAGAAISAVTSIVSDALAAGRAALDSHSPSRKAAELLGMPLSQGFALGITQGTSLVTGAVTGLTSQVLGIASAAIPTFKDIGGKIIGGFSQGVAEKVKIPAEAFQIALDQTKHLADGFKQNFAIVGSNLVDGLQQSVKSDAPSITSAFGTGLEDAKARSEAMKAGFGTVGGNLIAGMTAGVKAAAGSLAQAAVSAAQGALDAAKDALGIHSPSKEAESQVGVPFVDGIVKGIVGSSSAISKVVRTLSKQLTDEMKKVATEAAKAFETVLRDQLAAAVGFDQTNISNLNNIADLRGDDSKLGDLQDKKGDLEASQKEREDKFSDESAQRYKEHQDKLTELTSGTTATRKTEDYNAKVKDINDKAAADELDRQSKIREVQSSTAWAEDKAAKIAEINKTYDAKAATSKKQLDDANLARDRELQDQRAAIAAENASYTEAQSKAQAEVAKATETYQKQLEEVQRQINAEAIREQSRAAIATQAQNDLNTAQAQANEIRKTDAAAADKYYADRSRQILESAGTQADIADAEAEGDKAKVARLFEQWRLQEQLHQDQAAAATQAQKDNSPYAGLQSALTDVRDKLLAEVQHDAYFRDMNDKGSTKWNKINKEVLADTDALNGVQSVLDQVASAISAGVATGVNGDTSLVDSIKAMMDQAVKAAQEALGIHSPSKVFEEEVGAPSGDGIAKGLVKTIPKMTAGIARMATEGASAARNAVGGAMAGFSSSSSTFTNASGTKEYHLHIHTNSTDTEDIQSQFRQMEAGLAGT